MQANNPDHLAFARVAMPVNAGEQNLHPAAANVDALAGPAVHAAAHLGAQFVNIRPQAVAGEPFLAGPDQNEPGLPPHLPFGRQRNVLDAPRRPAPVPMPAELNAARLLFPNPPALPLPPFGAPRAAAPAPLPPGLDAFLRGLEPVRVPGQAHLHAAQNRAIQPDFFNLQPLAAQPEAVDQQDSPSSTSSSQTVIFNPDWH